MRRATSIFFGPAPWGPGEGSKGHISFNFNYKVNFKDFHTKLGVCSHKCKIQNILNRIFILLPRSCPGAGLRGAGGVKNFSVGICDGAPLTAHSSLDFVFMYATLFWTSLHNVTKYVNH